MTGKAEAQRRVDEIQSFGRELARLEQAGALALSQEQRDAIRAHHASTVTDLAQRYDVDRTMGARQMSLGMRIASFLGAVALAASVFFLFYQFWGGLGTALQVAILVAAPVATFIATVWVHGRDATGYFTKLAALVSFACLVLDISMLGQIFNITPSDKAFVVWGLYALLLAYACDLRLLLAAGILCFTAFIAARAGTWGGCYWLDFGERPENFFPAAALLLAAARLRAQQRFDGFAAVYNVFGLLTLLLPMLVLSEWGAGSYLPWESVTIEHDYQVLGFVASAIAIWLGARGHRGEVVNTGVTFFVIFLYTKFYDWWWESMPKYLFFLVVGLTAVLFLVVLRRLRASMAETAGTAP